MSTATRIAQVTIPVTDLDASVAFYREAFGAEFQPEIDSFQFGTFPDDSFFLLTVDQSGALGPAAFGLMVADVDAIYATAVEAGARSHTAPADYAWKPRSACVIDPSGNLVTVYQS